MSNQTKKSVIIYKNKSNLELGDYVTREHKVRKQEDHEIYLHMKHRLAMDNRSKVLTLLGCLLIAIAGHLLPLCQAVAPTIDYSHNMRILKLPKSTRVGEIIYRLRGSDGDPGGQLRFGVARGLEGRALVDIMPAPGSWNEADVYLRARLDRATPAGANPTPDPYQGVGVSDSPATKTSADDDDSDNFRYSHAYNLTIYVADAGNHTTQVDSTILITDDETGIGNNEDEDAATPTSGTANDEGGGAAGEQRKYYANAGNKTRLAVSSIVKGQPPQLSPFLRPRHVFSLPENAQPGESLGFLTVRESDKSDLPVRFELRGSGADHFAIKYVFGPRVGQSRAELLLRQPVDFERQNLFQLKVLALNAWTDVRYDTRNVATLDVVVAVGDVQDTAPQFRDLPRTLRVANTARPGDLLARVRAEDGDYADQRPVQYALDASSPLAQHFEIDKKTGEITLAKSVYELAATLHTSELTAAAAAGPSLLVFASELPDASSYDHLWPPMIARAELPLELVDTHNEPPRFVGGSSDASMTTPTLRGYLREFANTRTSGWQAQHDDSLDDQHHSTTGGHLVQWYTNLTADLDSATSQSLGHADSSGGQQQPSWTSIAQQLLKTTRGRPLVIDLGQGPNGTFELSLEGPDAHLFELTPSHAVSRLAVFQLQVAPAANKSLFDFDSLSSVGALDQTAGRFQVELVARDFGSPQRASARLRCQIDLIDVNDNAPAFDSDLYTFSVFENAQVGQILGSVRARDMDRVAGLGGGILAPGAYQRVRYTSLTGRDNHLFRLDSESGLITLEGQLDREKQDHYLLLAEARDASGLAANYTKLVVNVLDVNDNAPVFTQAHYDAVLLADGTFNQPLVVSATDNDEPNSANSQVSYEIIAGNQNDLFAIDSLSGAIYPTGGALAQPSRPLQLPTILSEPILPYINTREQPQHHQGKILPSPNPGVGGPGASHEIEETTVPNTGGGSRQPFRLNWPRSAAAGVSSSDESLALRHVERLDANLNKLLVDHPALDMLLNVEHTTGDRHHQVARAITAAPATQAPAATPQTAQSHRGGGGGYLPSLAGGSAGFDAARVPPLTSLVVRAHDFGIPLRSATCKVNIYNQALLQRSISVILNGTAEQLEQRREMLERAFGALTGSRAQIESIDALSDSSSLSVARMRLAVPAGHSLIDLTDLSSLMSALDYKVPTTIVQTHAGGGGGSNHLDQFKNGPIHYITTGDRVYPVHSSTNTTSGTGLYTDLTTLEAHNSNMLERKLLFYIIIVGICILALLVIWMIYFCCREDQQASRQVKVLEAGAAHSRHKSHRRSSHTDESSSIDFDPTKKLRSHAKQFGKQNQKKSNSTSKTHLMMDDQQSSELMMGRSASQLNLVNGSQEAGPQVADKTTQAKTAHAQHPIGKNLGKQLAAQGPHQLSIPGSNPQNLKPDHLSMYNGQVWFEQGGLVGKNRRGQIVQHPAGGQQLGPGGRRASSAPSAGGLSLDSGLHAIVAQGRSSALSPATSGFMTPFQQQQYGAPGQFFPNTLGYAENLATIATPSGGAYMYPAGTNPKRGLAGYRGRRKVAPIVDNTGGGGGHTNEAFERDLESGGESLRGGRDPRLRHKRPGTGKSSTGSHSSSDSSDARTRTLDESDEHESVLLDSDQELLGFDSTGTPIIATHTRNRAEPKGEHSQAQLGPPATTTGGPSSSAATTTSTTATTGTTVIGRAEVKPPAPPATSEKAAAKQASEIDAAAHTTANANKTVVASDSRRGSREERPQENAASGASQAKHTRKATPGGDTKRPSGDLMSELNERLNSANRQRTLRRQSADDDDESRRQQQQQVGQSETTLTQPLPIAAQLTKVNESTAKPKEAGRVKLESQQSTSSSCKLSQRRESATESLSCQSTMSSDGPAHAGGDSHHLRDMKNGELLEKQSIFAITYSGLATDKLPS